MQNNYDEIIAELYTFMRAGTKPGLERIKILLGLLGNPETKIKAIHVAGTNGKGSVCNMLASILQEAGLVVGLYTSPHISKFNERIRVNGKEISDQEIVDILNTFFKDAKRINATFFEITTALAIDYFRKSKVDIAIIETGMGGSWDSTNIVKPILSIITQIDLDHQDFLGETLQEIALEKAGIMKPRVPTLIADTHPELKELFIKHAKKNNTPIAFIENWINSSNVTIDEDLNVICDIEDGFFTYKQMILPVAGLHQVQNLKAIIAAYNNLKFKYPLDEETIKKGLLNLKQNTGFSSRIELVSKDPKIIVDVAHNPAGIMRLVETIQLSPFANQKFDIYFAAMHDKDIRAMLGQLKPICENLNIIQLANERAARIAELSEIAQGLGYASINTFDAPEKAFEKITADSIICGSFYTVEAFTNGMKNI